MTSPATESSNQQKGRRYRPAHGVLLPALLGVRQSGEGKERSVAGAWSEMDYKRRENFMDLPGRLPHASFPAQKAHSGLDFQLISDEWVQPMMTQPEGWNGMDGGEERQLGEESLLFLNQFSSRIKIGGLKLNGIALLESTKFPLHGRPGFHACQT